MAKGNRYAIFIYVKGDTVDNGQTLASRARRQSSLVQKMLVDHLIWVDGQASDNGPVEAGQIIRFEIPTSKTLTPEFAPLEVIYEDANWLIVSKPAGLTSVPGPHTPNSSLLNRIAGYLVEQKLTHRNQPS